MARDLGISFEVERNRGEGVQGFLRKLDGLGRRADDMTPAFQRIRRSFYAAERHLFETAGGGRWQPNQPKTLRRKAKHGQGDRVMRAKGDLMRALTTGRGETAVNEATADGLTLGVSSPAAGVAQRSANARRRRRLIQMSKQRRVRWTQMISDHLTGGDQP